MGKCATRIFVFGIFLAFVFSTVIAGSAKAANEETLMGYVVKHGKSFVIEADDGDYIVRGKDVSKLADKLVEVTGIITGSDRGDIIEVKSIQDVADTLPE
jgi:hypothetical protein